jgi:hypothetical protein
MKQFKTELDRRKAETVEVNDPVCDLTNCQTGDDSKISLKLIYTRRNKANNIISRERESICRIQHVDHAVQSWCAWHHQIRPSLRRAPLALSYKKKKKKKKSKGKRNKMCVISLFLCMI